MFRSLTIGAALLTLSAPVFAEEMLVIRSSGAGYEAGDSVDGSRAITLDANASLTLIASSGAVVTLTGPYSGTPDTFGGGSGGGDGDVLGPLAALIQKRSDGTRLGTVRAATPGAEESLPDPWAISVARSGHRCIRGDQPVRFWRPNSAESATLKISGGVRSARGRWRAGSEILTFSDVIEDGREYRVTMGGEKSVTLTFHYVPRDAEGASLASFMASKSCEGQALALLDRLQ